MICPYGPVAHDLIGGPSRSLYFISMPCWSGSAPHPNL
jgi:hypothetical protein